MRENAPAIACRNAFPGRQLPRRRAPRHRPLPLCTLFEREAREIPQTTKARKFYHSLYFRVILGIVLGILLGVVYPRGGEAMKPLGDGFIKLIRMMIAPIIFFTVVVGIANIGDMRSWAAWGSRRSCTSKCSLRWRC